MGIPERKEREKIHRRSLILQKAKSLIQERGVGNVSMQDIADKAEISKAALYLHFKSKEALLNALVSESCTEFVDFVQARITDEMSGIEALRTLWISYIDIFGESSDIFVCIGLKKTANTEMLSTKRLNQANKPFSQLVELIEKIINKGVADGTLLKTLKPKKITDILIFIASAVVQNTATLPEEKRNSKATVAEMKSVFEIILRGLASKNTDDAILSLNKRG